MGGRGITRASIAVAVAFAISVFCFTLFVWISFGGSVPLGPQGYRFSVQFGPEASNVFPNADVRISGVTVGEVAKVSTREGRIDTELELQRRYAPMPSDARAIVRSKTLLGEAYIELTPGTKRAPKVPEGGRLSSANVDEAQGLDRALGAFDRRTREDFRDFLAGLGDAFEGRGADVNAALGSAAPAVEDLRELVDVLDRQRTAVRGLVRDTGTALRTVQERRTAVQALARAGSRVLRTTAARDAQVTATVRALPGFMGSLRRFSADTVELSRAAAPALAGLRPVAPLVAPGLREAQALAPDLDRTVAALDRTVGASRAGVPALSRVLRAAAPLLRALDPAGQELVPVVRTLEAYRGDLVTGLANTAAATNASYRRADGTVQRYLRVLSHLSEESLAGATRRQPTHRENPYPAPGFLRDLVEGRPLKAIDCRSAAGTQDRPPIGSGAPPCVQAEPYAIAGGPRGLYPRVPRDRSQP
jgi:phospholipid/cholesterol/gamma-HCH transport system substrate-binding protein